MSGRRPAQSTIDNVGLPAKIKCIDCGKNLMGARYSNRQLNKYKESIYFKGESKAERPKCNSCTGAPGDELVCAGCGLCKSIEQFSKNARRKDRDNAFCWECQQRISDQEPNLEDAIKENEIEEEYHSKGPSVLFMGDLASSLPSAMKKSTNHTTSEAETDANGQVWITPPLSTGMRVTTSRGRSQVNVSNENSQRRASSQDSAATGDTLTTTRSGTTQSALDGYGDGDSAGSWTANVTADKWHKQGAVKRTATEKVRATVERSGHGARNRQRLREEDDDSDSEFEM